MKQNESEILEFITDAGLDIFSLEDLITGSCINKKNIESGLRNLIHSNYIKIIERGKYCRYDFNDEFVIGSFLAKDGGIAYWSAMNYHGFTEQIPNVVFIQTSVKKYNKTIFGVRYIFVQVKKSKLVGYKNKGYGNHLFKITDIEKTIVDCFDLPQYSGGYPEIIKAFAKAKLSARKLVAYCKAVDNIAVTKRLAYLTELLQKSGMNYFIEYALSVRNNKYNLFIHNGDKKGRTNRRWRLVINIPEEEIFNFANS